MPFHTRFDGFLDRHAISVETSFRGRPHYFLECHARNDFVFDSRVIIATLGIA